MKFSNLIKINLLLVSLIATNAVIAVENYEEQSEWSITPRIWLANEYSASNNLSTAEMTKFSPQKTPLKGLTLRYAPSSMENSSFLLSYMATGNQSHQSIYTDGTSTSYYNHVRERTDIELLYRYQLPSSILNFQAGVRTINLDETETGRAPTSTSIVNIGLGTNAPLFSDSDKHFWFTNVVYGFGEIKDVTDGSSSSTSTTAIDLNAGYLYSINDKMSTSIRYRSFTTHNADDGLASIRGYEFTLSYAF